MTDKKDPKDFSFYIPLDLDLEKASNGDWRVKGLASTEHMDLQGEIVRQNSLDITPLKEGKGLFNWDHKDGPLNILGAIDKADMTDKGLMVEGYLFKNSDQAKSVYNILTSLKDKDKKRLQMSIEGKILRRAGVNGREIAAARIDKVALTFDPVNPNTYTELVKSLTAEMPTEVLPETGIAQVVEVSESFSEPLEMLSLTDVKEIIDVTLAKAKAFIESNRSKQEGKDNSTGNGSDRRLSNEDIKKAVKEKIEEFIKSKDPIIQLGNRVIQLWDQTGLIGNVYAQETVYYRFKDAVNSNDPAKVKAILPEVLVIWRDEGLGIDEVESQALYAQASQVVNAIKKTLVAGNGDVPPSELKDGTALVAKPKKKKKKVEDK